MSQSGRAFRKPSRNTRAPAADSEAARGEPFERWYGRRAPAGAHHGLAVDEAFEQRRIQRDAGRARFDNEPDVDDDHATRTRGGGNAPDILDHPLLPGMRRRTGLSKGTAIHDHVVLQILNYHGAAAWIDLHILTGENWRRGRGSRR